MMFPWYWWIKQCEVYELWEHHGGDAFPGEMPRTAYSQSYLFLWASVIYILGLTRKHGSTKWTGDVFFIPTCFGAQMASWILTSPPKKLFCVRGSNICIHFAWYSMLDALSYPELLGPSWVQLLYYHDSSWLLIFVLFSKLVRWSAGEYFWDR